MTQQDVTSHLEQDSIGRLLIHYSLPAIAGMVVFSLYNIIDSIFIGHGVGALGISGLAVTFPVMNLTFAVGLLVGVGGASVSSIRLGQQDKEGATQVLGNVLTLNIINGVLFALLCLLFLDEILLAFGASPQTLPYARDFMQIILLGLPVTFVMFGLNHVMRATGYPKKAMISAVVTVGVNIVVAPIFIFGLEWSMRGAALATVIAQGVGLIWVLHHFRNPQNAIHFVPGIYRPRMDIVKSIYAIGLSPFLMNVCACAIVALINLGLKAYGGDMAVGAYGIVNRVLILFVMVVMGLSQGMQPIVGYNYGARKMPRVMKTLKLGVVYGGLIMLVGFLGSQFAPEAIAGLFTNEPELINMAVNGLRQCTLVMPLVGCQMVVTNFFQSIGKAKLAIVLSLTRQLLFVVPGLIILPRFFGLDGIWLSMPLADILATFTTAGVFYLFYRKELRVKMRAAQA